MGSTVYSATYSNVPVYELQLHGDHFVMRRRSDNYINATHILKAAELDKPARTRVLEKEVQLGSHEKVQGGYGKYQGTWIPLEAGIDLAKKYSVFHLIQPLVEYVAGGQSPPPAPKHTTASSSKKAPAKPKGYQAKSAIHQQLVQAQVDAPVEQTYEYDDGNTMQVEDEYDNTTIASASFVDEEDLGGLERSRKRRRRHSEEERHSAEQEYRIWADSLLDYYVVAGTDASHSQEYAPPPPPPGVNVNLPIDNHEHTALHWAAAMGDTDYVRDLIRQGANVFKGNIRGETPLIKCSVFANCFDRGTYRRMVDLLSMSATTSDKYGATVLHHIAKSALANAKGNRASHYLDVVLDKLQEQLDRSGFFHFVNERDQAGDTAFHIIVRASHRCTRLFQARGIPTDVPNKSGETVEAMLRDKMAKRAAVKRLRYRDSGNIVASSSPILPSSPVMEPHGASSPVLGGRFGDVPLASSMISTKSSQSFKKSIQNFYSTAVNNFMQAGEDELMTKDQLLTDIEAHLSRTNAKLIATQHECELLEAERVDPNDDVALLSSKRATLAKDAEAYSEQMQHSYLHRSIRELENKASLEKDKDNNNNNKSGSGNGNGASINDTELSKRIHMARLLHEQQAERRALTAKLVEAQAQAGMGEIGEMGIRVLMKTLGVTKEQVPSIVPEMIENMELIQKEPVHI